MASEQAVLPVNLVEPLYVDPDKPVINDLVLGHTAYLTPQSLHVDSQRRCWISPTCTYVASKDGDTRMEVQKRADGFHVWLPRGQRIRPRGEASKDMVPVMGLHLR